MTKEQSIMILSNFVKDYKNYPGNCVAIFPDDNGTMLLKSDDRGYIKVLYQRDNQTYYQTIEEYDRIKLRTFVNRILELLGNSHITDDEYSMYFIPSDKTEEDEKPQKTPSITGAEALAYRRNDFMNAITDVVAQKVSEKLVDTITQKVLEQLQENNEDEEDSGVRYHIFPEETENELQNLLQSLCGRKL